MASFGDDPFESPTISSILPPIPEDLNLPVHNPPNLHPSSTLNQLNIPPSSSQSLNLQGLVAILAPHELYITVVPLLPPPKTK